MYERRQSISWPLSFSVLLFLWVVISLVKETPHTDTPKNNKYIPLIQLEKHIINKVTLRDSFTSSFFVVTTKCDLGSDGPRCCSERDEKRKSRGMLEVVLHWFASPRRRYFMHSAYSNTLSHCQRYQKHAKSISTGRTTILRLR